MSQPPPHPGEYIRYDCLEPLGISVTRGAEALGVSRKTLSAVINGRANVTTNLALRLARAFGSTPEQWLRLQNAYSLWEEARRFDESEVEALAERSGDSRTPRAVPGVDNPSPRT